MRKKYTLLILLLAGTSMAAMAQNGGRSINGFNLAEAQSSLP